MGKRSRVRRGSARTVLLVGLLAGALGIGAPASALLGITLPPIPPLTTTPTPITVSTSPNDVTPNSLLDLSQVNPSIANILGLTNIQGGITQTTTTLTQLLSGLQLGATAAAPVVQAVATDAAATAITNLQERATATAAAALALDPATATEELQGIITDLQGQATSEVAGLLPLALTTGLQVVQNIVSPVCSLTAIPTSFIPGLGVDTTRAYIDVLPGIEQTDKYTNQLLRDTYSNVYDNTLASVNSIPTAGPILSALLLLLKYNWTSTYQPPTPTGGPTPAPIVTTTKALMNVPTPIDVDNDGLFDLCGTTSFALTGSGTSISGIKLTQTLTKMPLAKAKLPVEINGGLLNLINVGYDTRESTVPIVYTGSATMDASTGGRVSFDGNYAVHRGTTLTIPPVILKEMNLLTGQLPKIPPLFEPAPKPIVTQEFCIGGCGTLASLYRYENVPTATHVDAPLAPITTIDTNYTGAQTSDQMSYQFAVGGVNANIGTKTTIGADRPAVGSTPARVFSAPTAARSCLGALACSPNAATGDTAATVVGFTASSPTSLDQDALLAGANTANVCTGVGSINTAVRLNDLTQFYASAKKGGTGIGSGHIAVDTGGKAIDGCMNYGTVYNLAGYPGMNLTPGFKATNRSATYHQPTLAQPIPDTKSGAITCPADTTISYNAILPSNANLVPVLCPFPVSAGQVVITGSPTVDSTLTATTPGWGPAAPNAPSFTYQWYRCDSAGNNCAAIPGATNSTYVLQYGAETGPPPVEPTDYHHIFYVTVVGSNLDSSETGTSAKTPLVELPPPPVNTGAPVIGPNRHVGDPTTVTSVGTWNPGATSYIYQWQSCLDAAGLLCTDIAGATGTATNAAGMSYTLTAGEKGKYIRIGLKGKNHGGISGFTYSATGYVPGDPYATTPPGIKNGPANAVGASVATGDNLSATAGVWVDTTQPFTYRWQRCDAAGTPASCVDIPGATTATYQVTAPDDVNKTLRIVVTGHGLNGNGDAASGTTGVVLFNDLSAKTVTQIPDGTVNATAGGAGTTTYVGGSFDTVGAPTGGSGLITDSGAGNVVTLASATAGAANGGVNATISDGAGGYFLGGSFTQVKGVQCPGLAHIVSDGSVDQNYCYSGLTGTVRALTRATTSAAGTTKVLAVGGDFSYGGHSNLMFIDPTAPANPVYLSGGDPNGVVKSLSVNASSTVYLAGQFSKAGGTDAGLLASATLTWTSGVLTSVPRTNWSAGVCIGVPSGTSACTDPAASVNTVAWLSSGFVAVGGRFDRNFRVVNGASPTNSATRSNVLLVGESGTSPTLLGWAPVIAGGAQTVNAIAPGTGSGLNNITIYIGGDFDTVNGVAGTKNLAEVACTVLGGNTSSGTANNSGPMNTWLPKPNGPVTSLAWYGNSSASNLLVGGAFTTIDSRPNTATPFTTLVRHRLAKINIAGITSSTLPVVDGTWDPNAGRTVRTVSRDAATGKVTVGGDFLVLGGQTRNNLAEFDPNTGVTAWNPSADGTVNALARDGGTVYAGGSFGNVGGAARSNLAAIDGGSGAVTGWNPGANGTVNAIDTNGGVVYAGGAFSTLAGAARANLGAVNGDGTSNGWTADTDGPVFAVRSGGGAIYVGGAFANVGGQSRNNAAAVSTGGTVSGYDPNANGAVRAIVPDAGNVYLGGDFTQVGGQGRGHVARVDGTTGAVDAWNPGVDGVVNALYLVGAQLFVGGQFANAGGASRSNLANLDTGSDNALSFNAAPNGTVKALSRTAGGSIAVGGAFTIIAGQAAPALGFFGG